MVTEPEMVIEFAWANLVTKYATDIPIKELHISPKRDTQQNSYVRALGLGLSFAMQLQNSFVNKEELCMPTVELCKLKLHNYSSDM